MKVLILLSTFNGHLFLPELLDSLYCQEEIVFEILVRDDGSTDDTKNILRRYNNRYGNITIAEGKNIGAKNSFLELIQMASKRNDFDYAAFCDQDDVWNPDKLKSAIYLMEKNKACFYYSPYQLVNEKLCPLPDNHHFLPIRDLAKSLVYNSVTGCTIVCNSHIIKEAAKFYPQYAMMHDSWIFKVALSLQGKVVIDSTPHILYRQHGNNVVGGRENTIQIIKRRANNFLHPKCARYNEAEDLYYGFYNKMSDENKSIMKDIHNYKQKSLLKRMSIAFNPKFKTGRASNDLIFKIAILTKRF